MFSSIELMIILVQIKSMLCEIRIYFRNNWITIKNMKQNQNYIAIDSKEFNQKGSDE